MEYRRAPTLTVRAVFRGGSATNPKGKEGATSLMADLLTQGTEKMSASELQEQIDFLGASLSASSAADYVSASLDCLAKDSDKALSLLADVLRRPTFPQAEIDRRRALKIADLQTLPEDPEGLAERVALETVFAGHPYGRFAAQTSLKALTREDIVGAYQRNLNPRNTIISAVGDFKAPAMLAKIKKLFEDWNAPPPTPSPLTNHRGERAQIPTVKNPAPQVILVDNPEATQTQFRFVRSGISMTSPDFYAAQVASAALGGGFSSRLIEEVRVNKALTYDINSSFLEMMFGGAFRISTFTKLETTVEMFRSVRSVLSRAAEKGFTQAEIKRVKGYLIGSFAASVQTPESLAGQLAFGELYGLPQDTLARYLSRLNAVTFAQVNRVAKTYFKPSSMSIILAGPASKIGTLAKALGATATRTADSVGK